MNRMRLKSRASLTFVFVICFALPGWSAVQLADPADKTEKKTTKECKLVGPFVGRPGLRRAPRPHTSRCGPENFKRAARSASRIFNTEIAQVGARCGGRRNHAHQR